jgi:hypothetical protein
VYQAFPPAVITIAQVSVLIVLSTLPKAQTLFLPVTVASAT